MKRKSDLSSGIRQDPNCPTNLLQQQESDTDSSCEEEEEDEEISEENYSNEGLEHVRRLVDPTKTLVSNPPAAQSQQLNLLKSSVLPSSSSSSSSGIRVSNAPPSKKQKKSSGVLLERNPVSTCSRVFGQSKIAGSEPGLTGALISPYISGEPYQNLLIRTGSKAASFDKKKKAFDPKKPCHFLDRLSDEVILMIFRFLNRSALVRCALTCRRLRNIAYVQELWKQLDLGSKSISADILHTILDRGTTALRLSKAKFTNSSRESLPKEDPDRRMFKLRFLDLSMASISPTCLENLLGKCSDLYKLALENLEINRNVCRNIAGNPDLHTLHLEMCSGLDESGLELILTNCSQLRELNIGWTRMSPEMVRVLVHLVPANLEKLNIAGCRESIEDDHVSELSQKCRNLVEIDISDAANITSKSIEAVLENLENLESLSTSRCYQIAPFSYLNVATQPNKIKFLNVFGVLRDTAETQLRSRLPHVEVNKVLFSSIARPTVGIKRSSIWNVRVRDYN